MTAPRYVIHTDGGCRPNPGPGGWGAVVEGPEGTRELSGGEPVSTNNRMELTAAIRALESVPEGAEVELVTDSTYLQQGITKWLAGWRRRGWVTAAKEPVKNRDLWIALDEAARRHRVRWSWTRGHAGHGGNERAHELAAAAIPGGGRRAVEAAVAGARPGPGADAVEVFLGVAWSGKEGRGAWGAVLRHGEHERELSGRLDVTSANAAHIASAVHTLEAIRGARPAHVVTAADYLRDGATTWLPAWRGRGWATRDGKPVANRDWWERLERELGRREVSWQVAGGAELPAEVERARQLARQALAGD